MKKALFVSFCLLFVLTSLVMARPALKGTSPADLNIQEYHAASDRALDGYYATAQVPDTYLIYEANFDVGGLCNPEGWFFKDLTAQTGNWFHVDTYRAISGSQSMWCGARPATTEPLCTYQALPGYGNNWDQNFTSVWFAVTPPVNYTFSARYDSEPGYDFSYLDYRDAGDTVWFNLATFDGAQDSSETYTFNPGASVLLRWRFASDGAWSDEDALWDTQGAIILDDFILTDAGGPIDTQDFEAESIGSPSTNDGDWVANPSPGYGDFSGLFPGVTVLQQDECTRDLTCLWGFFRGSTENYACGGHPEQLAVPKVNDRGQYMNDEIWSPFFEFNPGGIVPGTASRCRYKFFAYRELPLDNLIFYEWHIRTKVGVAACPGPWQDRNFVYYGTGPDWLDPVTQEVGDLVTPGATHMQLGLGVRDMCLYWCGYYGTGACHSHAPLFDRISVSRINLAGPIFNVRDIEMFQDNFPGDGTTTGTVRCDAAIDRMPASSPNIYPGDSILFTVNEPTVGLGTEATTGKAAVYCYVQCTPGLHNTGSPMSDDLSRFEYLGPAGGGWHKFQCDTVYSGVGTPVPDKFCFDLNDQYFTPPDRIDYYLGATDANGFTTYWSSLVTGGTTNDEAAVRTDPEEIQCLPTGESDVLYVDDFSGRGAQPYFDSSFDEMGYVPDRYDTRGPSSLVANGPGARAATAQINNVYKKILWNTGNLSIGLIGDGTGNPEKSQDAQMLFNFLDQSGQNVGLYMSGDDLSSEFKALASPAILNLETYIPHNLITSDHTFGGTMPVAPLVVKTGAAFTNYAPDTMVAYGGCPLINDFDVLEPTGGSAMDAYYAPTTSNGAIIHKVSTNAQSFTARVVMAGFSYHYIRDDRPVFPYDRLAHLISIIRWFENIVDPPTAIGDDPSFKNSLAQNYPNPFNPQTTIAFSLKENAHVSLKVYNVAGQLVRTLVNENRVAGVYTDVQWDGRSDSGSLVSSGVYFYKLVSKNFSMTKKMVLLK
jgi:hypothetical protein